MDEYKTLINDKLGQVVNKAKEFGDSAGISDVYSDGISRAKSYAKIAKLNLEINRQADELRRVYVEIGKLYYELNEDKPGSLFAPLFSQIKELEKVIEEKNSEISEVKGEIAERSRRHSSANAQESSDEEVPEADDIEVEIFEDDAGPADPPEAE